MQDESRQAGVLEITPQMASAGADVLRLALLSVAPCGGEAELARDVFHAMLAASGASQCMELAR